MTSRLPKDDPFFRVPTTIRPTSEGPVELPIRYWDVTAIVAVFAAPRAGAEAILEGTGLEPGLSLGERVGVAMAFYEYRDTSVGTYNEVGTSIFAVRRGERARLGHADLLLPPRRRTVGAYVVDLPVTTAAANAAGREIWGYPKFVTQIPLTLRGRALDTSVRDPNDGSPIVRLAGRLGWAVPTPPLSIMTYTRLDGALIRTHVDVRGWMLAHAPGSARLEVGSSKHGMAERLRTLGLEGAVPRLVAVTDRFQSLLWPGETVPEGR